MHHVRYSRQIFKISFIPFRLQYNAQLSDGELPNTCLNIHTNIHFALFYHIQILHHKPKTADEVQTWHYTCIKSLHNYVFFILNIEEIHK